MKEIYAENARLAEGAKKYGVFTFAQLDGPNELESLTPAQEKEKTSLQELLLLNLILKLTHDLVIV